MTISWAHKEARYLGGRKYAPIPWFLLMSSTPTWRGINCRPALLGSSDRIVNLCGWSCGYHSNNSRHCKCLLKEEEREHIIKMKCNNFSVFKRGWEYGISKGWLPHLTTDLLGTIQKSVLLYHWSCSVHAMCLCTKERKTIWLYLFNIVVVWLST